MEEKFFEVGNPLFHGSVGRFLSSRKFRPQEIRNFLRKQNAHTLFRNARYKYRRNKTISFGPRYKGQIDLIEMKPIAKKSEPKFVITLIDTFSRKAFVEPISNKSGPVVAKGLMKIFGRSGPFRNLCADGGREWTNKFSREVFSAYNVHVYTPKSFRHCGMVERFNRTFKRILYGMIYDGKQWLSSLQPAVDTYNKRTHRVIKTSPNFADAEENKLIILKALGHDFAKVPAERPVYSIGDYVRVAVQRKPFEKSFSNRTFSEEIFQIYDIHYKKIPLYLLQRMSDGSIVEGGFYRQQLTLCC